VSRLQAYIWWCGDEDCDCTCPQIDRVTPRAGHPGWINRERLWTGTFHSRADREESAEQVKELEAAADRYGIELDDDHQGEREEVGR
jgi:hypothetical protein